ncbi:hypothetical protein Q9966_011024 [Columba livia]|nr:hypothetical protein Q9966_011024 [Columba livia]
MWSLQAWAVGKHFASHRAQCRQGLEVQLTICFCRSLLGPVARPSDSSVFSYSISFGYSSVLPFFLKNVEENSSKRNIFVKRNNYTGFVGVILDVKVWSGIIMVVFVCHVDIYIHVNGCVCVQRQLLESWSDALSKGRLCTTPSWFWQVAAGHEDNAEIADC